MKFRIRLLITAIISALFFTLPACVKENHVSEEKPPDNAPGNQAEHSTANNSASESGSHAVETEPLLHKGSVAIGGISFSLSESRQDILEKLDAVGFAYGESKSDYPDEAKYDFYYNIAGCMQIYFLDDNCVRIRLIHLESAADWNAQTGKGLHPGDTYFQMMELYGNDFETHVYSGKEIYTVYRYSVSDCIFEFGIFGENSEDIYNIDIYFPSQYPIYRYGEEILEIIRQNAGMGSYPQQITAWQTQIYADHYQLSNVKPQL